MESNRDEPQDGSADVFAGDELDDAVIAADDTGLLGSEKLITEAEIEAQLEQPASNAGDEGNV
jgi:hypothetical protein